MNSTKSSNAGTDTTGNANNTGTTDSAGSAGTNAAKANAGSRSTGTNAAGTSPDTANTNSGAAGTSPDTANTNSGAAKQPFDAVAFYQQAPHFLQGPAWAAFQRARGNEVLERSGTAAGGEAWSSLAIVERGKFSSRLYCPYGPQVTGSNALAAALEQLKQDAKSRHVEFVRVEPRGTVDAAQLICLGLKPAAREVQPSHTIINNVSAASVDEEAIFKRASQTRRQLYRYSLRDGVTYRCSYDPADLGHFLTLIHLVARRTGMQPHADSYFETMAEVLFPLKAAGMLLAELNGEVLATLIFYTNGSALGYAHAASTEGHRKLSPPSGLFIYAQLFARESGHVVLDTYGVAPPGASKEHPWAGFTQFKESFGGQRIAYAGTWELPISKLRYGAYRLAGRLLER